MVTKDGIFKITQQSYDEAIKIAAEFLRKGELIALPTDTIYGIACLVELEPAIQRLYQIKQRDPNKPISICVSDISDMSKYATITAPSTLLQRLLPGQVTLCFKRSPVLTSKLNPGNSLIGIRIPKSRFICDVVRQCGQALALTSANISSHRAAIYVEDFKEIHPHLPIIFDDGKTSDSREGSTVVDLSVSGHYQILRNGSVLESTREILDSFGWKPITDKDAFYK